MQIVLAVFLFLVVGLRFVRRYRQEVRRQRALTWPRATAVLEDEPDELQVESHDGVGTPVFFRAQLRREYVFYARGQRFTGNQLAPELQRLNRAEAESFLNRLNRHRSYQVCYDPNEPSRNYLTVGRQLLGNGHLLLYATLGLAAPIVLLLLDYGGHTRVPDDRTQLLVWVAILLGAVCAVMYFVVKPIFDLGTLLEPTPPRFAPDYEDELLGSLAKRPEPPAQREKVRADNR